MSVRIAVAGATGRMGQTILDLASNDAHFEITGILENHSHPLIGKSVNGILPSLANHKISLVSSLTQVNPKPQILIDFTQPQATMNYLHEGIKLGIGLVIGTTGCNEVEKREIHDASSLIPIILSSNMSVGMNLLFSLVQEAATKLGPDYDVEILEAHHHFKKDAPSGSALSLGESVARAWDVNLKDISTHGREGQVGERKKGTIGFHALRGGDIVGDHTVFFAGPGERLELTHRAHTREAFAQVP